MSALELFRELFSKNFTVVGNCSRTRFGPTIPGSALLFGWSCCLGGSGSRRPVVRSSRNARRLICCRQFGQWSFW